MAAVRTLILEYVDRRTQGLLASIHKHAGTALGKAILSEPSSEGVVIAIS